MSMRGEVVDGEETSPLRGVGGGGRPLVLIDRVWCPLLGTISINVFRYHASIRHGETSPIRAFKLPNTPQQTLIKGLGLFRIK